MAQNAKFNNPDNDPDVARVRTNIERDVRRGLLEEASNPNYIPQAYVTVEAELRKKAELSHWQSFANQFPGKANAYKEILPVGIHIPNVPKIDDEADESEEKIDEDASINQGIIDARTTINTRASERFSSEREALSNKGISDKALLTRITAEEEQAYWDEMSDQNPQLLSQMALRSSSAQEALKRYELKTKEDVERARAENPEIDNLETKIDERARIRTDEEMTKPWNLERDRDGIGRRIRFEESNRAYEELVESKPGIKDDKSMTQFRQVRSAIGRVEAKQKLEISKSPKLPGTPVPTGSGTTSSITKGTSSKLIGGISKALGKTAAGRAVKKVVDKVAKAIGKAVDLIVTGIFSETGPIGKAIGWIAGKLTEISVKFLSRVGKDVKDFAAGLIVIGSAGITVGWAIFIAGVAAFFGQLVAPILSVVIGFPVLLAIIIYISTVGAWVVPPWRGASYTIDSSFIEVTKTYEPNRNFENSEVINGPLVINYTITVTAEKSTLTNIRFGYTCVTRKEGTSPPCPPISPSIPVPGDENYPLTISPGAPYVFTYSQSFVGSTYTDIFVRDTFTVTADAEGLTGETSSASAVVRIGNPPEDCPSGWPLAGSLTRGAYSISTHAFAEAIDIAGSAGTPVNATHSGVARVTVSGALGKNVEVISFCEGRDFFSRYSHMDSVIVADGASVGYGEQIGTRGDTGNSSGPHLHYEFKYADYTPTGGLFNYEDNPPYMMVPYVPKDLPRGCNACDTAIP